MADCNEHDDEDHHVSDVMDSLSDYVIGVDADRVRAVLDQLGSGQSSSQLIQGHSTLLHRLIKATSPAGKRPFDLQDQKIRIVYMLVNAGADVNSLDAKKQTPLWLAMKCGLLAVAEVLLQCGALTSFVYRNQSLWQWVTTDQPKRTTLWFKQSDQLRRLFRKYGQGLAEQVRAGDFQQMRISLNYWCRTDLVLPDGRKLINLSLENGHDHITELLIRVNPYMKVAHHVLAQDVASVDAWFEQQKQQSSSTSPVFYSSDDGMVPLLYFAIQYQNVKLMQSLMRNGHRATFPISHESKGDRAVLFSALEPHVDVRVVQALLDDVDSHQEHLHHLFWLDRNPLHVALVQHCSAQVVRLLLTLGGPLLLCLRNADGQTGRDLAVSLSLTEHVRVIDQVVTDWLLAEGPNADHWRSLLALCSYELNMVIRPLLCRPAVRSYQREFTQLQVQLEELNEALINDDEEAVQKLLFFESETLGRHNLALDARLSGDGLPLLHLAVLNKQTPMIRLMVSSQRVAGINGVRDQFRCSALHYAYADGDSQEIQQLLLEAGCSEVAFDMNGRRPNDYQEMQGSPEMIQFLSRRRDRDYRRPWIDPLEPEAVARHRKRQWQKRVQDFVQNPQQHQHHHHHHHHQHQHQPHQQGHGHSPAQPVVRQLDRDSFSKRLISHLVSWNTWCSIL